jgi:PPOX class probable F420-dependent enzyme
VLAVTLLAGMFMTAAGAAALLAPGWFADAAGFPRHPHFVHDAGAFQLGIGVTPVAGATGSPWPWPGSWLPTPPLPPTTPSTSTWAAAVATPGGWPPCRRWLRSRWPCGWASPALARFVRQKTVLVTTDRRDGRPVGTPVSLAVDGDHAYLRSFEQAGKTRRLRNNPRVEVAPSTARGRPTGPALQATARRLEGAEARRAARLLAAKHPVLHGLLVPLTHRLGRAKTGKTVHLQLTPLDHGHLG